MNRMLVALVAVCLPMLSVAAPPITEPVQVSMVSPMGITAHPGLCVSPQPNDTCEIAKITGKGTFLSGFVTKAEGATDISFVELIIDGRAIFNSSIAALKNQNLTQNNAFGEAVFPGEPLDTVVIGFPYPIPFESSLVLRVVVGTSDTGISQINGRVIAGSQ
jgi:hypothetical protein